MQNACASLRRLLAFIPLALAAIPVPAALAAKPSIASLKPATVNALSPAFTLTITGTNFTSSTVVIWQAAGGAAVTLNKISVTATSIKATVPSTAIEKAATVSVTAENTGVKSTPATFKVLPPVPVISSLTPSTAIAGGPKFTLTIAGSNFTSSAKTAWIAAGKSNTLVTTFKNTKELLAAVPAALIAKAGSATVTVTTAGGTSKAKAFTIGPAIPIVSAISPSTAIAGGAGFTLTVKGYNFTGGVARWNGVSLATKVLSATELTASVPAADIASTGTAKITVKNAKGVSAAVVFTIKPAKPTISALHPSSTTAGSAGFALTIAGTGFIKGATTVSWSNGKTTVLTPSSYTGTTQLTVSISATLIANAGAATVSVTTAGGTSAGLKFTINPQPPVLTSLSPTSVTAGQSTPLPLTINGSGFTSTATVNWTVGTTTTQLQKTSVTTTQIQATVPVNLMATQVNASITVTTSVGTSNSLEFAVISASGPACANDGSGNSKLSGAYSFQFSQIDPSKNNELNMNIGTFTADGKGGISAGASDQNGPYFTAATQNAFTGTYSVGSDNRGLLTLNYTGGATAYLCFALNSVSSGVSGGGHLVSDLTNAQIDSGTFAAQPSGTLSTSSVNGSWAYGLQGIKVDTSSGQPVRGAAAGYLTFDGGGNVTAGETDISQDAYSSSTLTNSYKAEVGITGTYTLASTGRGTLALTLAGIGTANYVFYVAGANEIYLLSSDAGGQHGSVVTSGNGYLRSGAPYSNASLPADSVFIAQAWSNTNSSSYNERLVQVGTLDTTSPGKYTQSYDENDAGSVSLQQTLSGTFSVDSSGRVTLNGTSPATYAYLVAPNQGFAVQGNLGVTFEYFESQPSTTFSDSTFNGGYAQGSVWYGLVEERDDSGEIIANGSGALSGNLDVSALVGTVNGSKRNPRPEAKFRPTPMAAGVDETYTASSTGRYVLSNGGIPYKVLYLVSSQRGYEIDISGAPWLPIEEFDHQ